MNLLLVGLLIGFVIGQLVPSRRIHEWRIMVSLSPKLIRPWLHKNVVGVAVTAWCLALMATCAIGVIFGYSVHVNGVKDARDQAQATCQANVNRQFQKALLARSKTARAAILAPSQFFSDLLDALTHPGGTEEHKARVLAKLIAANRLANDAYTNYITAQRLHPLPDLPDCTHPESEK